MDIEEEDAPALVDANEMKEINLQHEATSATSQLRDLSLVKVPLTIVTGESKEASTPIDLLLISTYRLPWCREDYAGQLHPQRAAWQENCGHSKRLVPRLTFMVPLLIC